MKFTDLNLDKNLLKSINNLGYQNTLEVQSEVIPQIMKKKDVIIKSATGSGKTASFLIPIINDIDFEVYQPSALILTPTRELAIQIKDVAENLGIYKKIKTVAIYGRAPFKQQITDLKQRCHIVSGSIGRVLDMIEREHLDLSKIKYVVIDEADEMFKMGFIEKLDEILSYIPLGYNLILCSATFNDKILEIQNKYISEDYKFVEIKSEKAEIEEIFYNVKEYNKQLVLDNLLSQLTLKSAIIFSNYQQKTEEIFRHLNKLGVSVTMIHGGLQQKERLYNLNDFSAGKYRILVATDVAARGLDIDKVEYIINYDVPDSEDIYTHRIGRSARVNEKGVAYTFIANNKQLVTEKMVNEVKDVDFELLSKPDLKHLSKRPELKKDKYAEIKADIYKIYINGGKSKKIRPTNIVAAICDIKGVEADDIGVIKVQDNQSYVDILNGKGKTVLDGLRKSGIKGKKLKIERARNK